ncbi:MAG TPA: amidase family protein [Vicinamibacterales bacterium]|nr:amidase family protein [Vicinamibacterales bacterium]
MTQFPAGSVFRGVACVGGFLVLSALGACNNSSPRSETPFSVVEASIPDMQQAMRDGRITSRQLVEQYLIRIGMYEDRLNAAIAVNAKALEEADRLDRERASGKVRGPLHGIPIALKDNIHTTDMPTTGGAIAFEGLIPPYEATLTTNLREAGAVIIAKTTLTELANFVTNGMPGNYNALAGYGMNPYDPRRDPRQATADGRPVLNTGGSSSGAGTAANFWAANVGTETSGSILSPSNQNMLAGIKPTVGRISRHGVIPITADQDTAGPMAKWVADAAILLGALESAAPDPNDPATKTCQAPPNRDYTPFLKREGLKGARIGIPRANYYDRITPPGEKNPRGGLNEAQARSMADAIDVLKREGATVIDADIPSVVDQDPKNNFLLWGNACDKGPRDPNCASVLWYGMKRDFNAWLASLGPAAPVKTLAELRAFNTARANRNAIKYGQINLDRSDELDIDKDRAKWQRDRDTDIRLAATHGIDEVMKAQQLDALLFPGASGAGIAAKPGYPTVIVPFGLFVPQPPLSGGPGPAPAPYPEGFTLAPAPYGVSFTGMACSEPRLIELAYAFEQATKKRVPPPSVP